MNGWLLGSPFLSYKFKDKRPRNTLEIQIKMYSRRNHAPN